MDFVMFVSWFFCSAGSSCSCAFCFTSERSLISWNKFQIIMIVEGHFFLYGHRIRITLFTVLQFLLYVCFQLLVEWVLKQLCFYFLLIFWGFVRNILREMKNNMNYEIRHTCGFPPYQLSIIIESVYIIVSVYCPTPRFTWCRCETKMQKSIKQTDNMN